MEKRVKYTQLNESAQKLIREQLEKSGDKINEDDITVYPSDDNASFVAECGDKKIEVRLKQPDQGTTNDIWKTITTAGVVIAAVGVALICSKKKPW